MATRMKHAMPNGAVSLRVLMSLCVWGTGTGVVRWGSGRFGGGGVGQVTAGSRGDRARSSPAGAPPIKSLSSEFYTPAASRRNTGVQSTRTLTM